MPNLLCFGDSNTYGTLPMREEGAQHRHGADVRWTGVARRALGADWNLVEEGLPGRTAQFADPVMDGVMDGMVALRMALQSHGPLDALTIMLGTNDVKARFGATPEGVTGGIAALLDLARGTEMQSRHGGFKILLICPPPVVETGLLQAQFYGATVKSRALAPLYAGLAAAHGVGFLDAGQVMAVSAVDGVHYEAEAHGLLGAAVATALRALV